MPYKNRKTRKGGSCACGNSLFGMVGKARKGGYRATKKNLNTLRRYKRGESIGFTATSSLKAKGLIPRTSAALKGKYIVSPKYR